MALILIGIDEAGYGPLLGPLCVGYAAVRVEAWAPGDPAPDLWAALSSSVCRAGGRLPDARGRIAIDDSKRLKLPNAGARHPLTHLERGVHAFLRALGRRPADDHALLAALGADAQPAPWYAVQPTPSPASADPLAMDIAGNVLARGLADANITILEMACAVINEATFNATVKREGTKAAATALGLGAHVRDAWDRWGTLGTGGAAGSSAPDGVRIVCDRQGGRTDYEQYLTRLVPGAGVRVIEQRPERARYELASHDRAVHVLFQPEAEQACLPVALASMIAKLCRETLMARFNRYWSSRIPELKPTAGYAEDARRWLKDAGPRVTRDDRAALIRIA